MDKNKEKEKYPPTFNILDLPEYGYPYKDETKAFGEEFNFSITAEPKYDEPIADSMYFLDKYQEKDQVDTQKKTSLFNCPQGMPKDPIFSRYKKQEKPEEFHQPYDYNYAPNEDQAVFVNACQYPYIKRRKERRDYLDSLETKKNVPYQHASRHNHAMKRPRAPSGRFLTKKEVDMQRDNSIKQ